jgi:hypothetical protein
MAPLVDTPTTSVAAPNAVGLGVNTSKLAGSVSVARWRAAPEDIIGAASTELTIAILTTGKSKRYERLASVSLRLMAKLSND